MSSRWSTPSKQLAAQAVDRLALLVHDVVVLEQVFARFEVLRFDGFLRALDALGDHLRLDGHALFHAQPLQQGADPLLGEDAHQVVFEGEIEARLAGIALAAGAAAELVVDAPRLVALGAEDEEAAGFDHLLVLLFARRRRATLKVSAHSGSAISNSWPW